MTLGNDLGPRMTETTESPAKRNQIPALLPRTCLRDRTDSTCRPVPMHRTLNVGGFPFEQNRSLTWPGYNNAHAAQATFLRRSMMGTTSSCARPAITARLRSWLD